MYANDSLAEAFLPKAREFLSLHSILLVIGGTIAIAISSKIQIPFAPIPVTMQTFVILALSMAFGPRLAVATTVLYALEGAVGLPVFAGTPARGIGITYMLGPTGGYILGFILAAFACGWLARAGWDRRVLTTVLAMVIGNALIYIPGLLWLGTITGWRENLLDDGFLSFIYIDMMKIALAAAVLPFVWKMVRR